MPSNFRPISRESTATGTQISARVSILKRDMAVGCFLALAGEPTAHLGRSEPHVDLLRAPRGDWEPSSARKATLLKRDRSISFDRRSGGGFKASLASRSLEIVSNRGGLSRGGR